MPGLAGGGRGMDLGDWTLDYDKDTEASCDPFYSSQTIYLEIDTSQTSADPGLLYKKILFIQWHASQAKISKQQFGLSAVSHYCHSSSKCRSLNYFDLLFL